MYIQKQRVRKGFKKEGSGEAQHRPSAWSRTAVASLVGCRRHLAVPEIPLPRCTFVAKPVPQDVLRLPSHRRASRYSAPVNTTRPDSASLLCISGAPLVATSCRHLRSAPKETAPKETAHRLVQATASQQRVQLCDERGNRRFRSAKR